ncbi:MAG: TetR/AcrR family transcriptional regulator [Streptococcus mitis]|nr:TetR/AcrR family transcriptional regulator [Streptococcus mitis]MDU4467029.1 TetR/AcrR family transcriptional regulator [Streptococcus mitis]
MRKEEKTRLRREKIITAALFEFATKGYQGFVINELCKVDGFSKEFCIIIFQGNQTSI